jgi:hypothetical protein
VILPDSADDIGAITPAGGLLRDFDDSHRNGSLENQKRLLQAVLEKVFLEGDEIGTISPRRETYAIFASSCGPDGIRVPMSMSYAREFVSVRGDDAPPSTAI